MLNHDYLAQSLRRPLPTKDGGTLRTVADAANYIVALPEDRRRTHWDRTVQLLLDMADPAEISRQLELALFYDRQLNLRMRTSTYLLTARFLAEASTPDRLTGSTTKFPLQYSSASMIVMTRWVTEGSVGSGECIARF
jgi:hypothetical protein